MALTDSKPTADAGGLTVIDERLIDAGMVARTSAGAPRLGILPWHSGVIVSGTAGMAYSVAPFVGVASRTSAGIEKVANDAATSVSTTAAPGSNSRIDLIYFKPNFVASADANNVPAFGVVQGTASGSPVKPALPAGAVELATAVITSTTTATNTATISQTAQFTAAAGGTVWVRNSTELTAWTPADGAQAYRLDNAGTYVRQGGAWLPLLIPKTSWSPTFSNFGAGTSTIDAWYQVTGNRLKGTLRITLASGFTMNAGPLNVTTLPVAPANGVAGMKIADGSYRKSGSGDYLGALILTSATAARSVRLPSGSSFWSDTDQSNPFTWAVNDQYFFDLDYPV